MSHPRATGAGPRRSEHFEGGGLRRALLDIGVQSSSWKGNAAGFDLLVQSEKLLSQLALKSRQNTLGLATSHLGEEEVQTLALPLPGKRSVDSFYSLLPSGGSPAEGPATQRAMAGGLPNQSVVFHPRSTAPCPTLLTCMYPSPVPALTRLPSGAYCLHSVHSSLCLLRPSLLTGIPGYGQGGALFIIFKPIYW